MENNGGGIKLLDAVEALSTIVDAPLETLAEPLAKEEEVGWKSVAWLRRENKEQVVANVKEIFNVILRHLKDSYHEKGGTGYLKNLEGIKTIMLIVGEAAKRIDRYTDLFHTTKVHSVTETREYKALQDFYNKRIAKTIDEAILSKWLFALSQRGAEEVDLSERSHDAQHVYVDLDSVKNDTEYELFFIRKEDGSRFFSPRLIRNITLICDFGVNLGQEREWDPLVDLPVWQDRLAYGVASYILQISKPIVQEAYPLIIHHKDLPFCTSIHKALLALYLAANEDRLQSEKRCSSYFADFQMYLRKAVESRTYQHMIAFPHQEHNPEDVAGKKIIDVLLKCIFENKMINERLHDYFCSLINESTQAISQEHKEAISLENPLWSGFACNYVALQKFFRHHSNGPLTRVLSVLEEGGRSFDPLMLQRFPENLFNIELNHQSVAIHQMGSPTTQEVIHKADIALEWLAYLHEKKSPVLLLNFQDNTSWREYARAYALEKLQEAGELEKKLTVVTLPKDTEFYWQQMPYEQESRFVDFKAHLIKHVLGEKNSGFYFPASVKPFLSKAWLEGVITVINKIFFSGKNVLSKEARKDFIEIFYAFLELKILEIIKPSDLFLSCKDGIDVAPPAAVVLFVLVKALQGKSISEEEKEHLNEIIYRPALLSRERLILPKRIERMLSAIKTLENGAAEHKATVLQKELARYFNLDLSK